jgi:nucleotide-binding universal stress UspA family protein
MPRSATSQHCADAQHPRVEAIVDEKLPVVVGVDGSPGDDAAVQWAVADALSRKARLRIVHAYEWSFTYTQVPIYRSVPEADLQMPRHVGEQLVANMVTRAVALSASDVAGTVIDGDAVQVLMGEGRHACDLVLGSRHLKALGSAVHGSVGAAVAARATCPVVVVRGPAGRPDKAAAVVAGIDGSSRSQTVLEYAFDYASRRDVALRAVLCWHPDLRAVLSWRPEPPAPNRVDAWLAETLAGWRQKYPDVVVHPEVIREHPVTGLVHASTAQHLLVVGSHGHRALTSALLGSTTQGVLHHATGPVAVVPTHKAP